VIFGSEAALNLESFEALPWATPAIAWGATIIIGIALGLASHFHGTVLKQYAYWFGAEQHDHHRGPAWRMVLIGSITLAVALGFVYYARSAYFIAYVGPLSGFGQSDANLSVLWIVGGSLLGNTIVYLVGVLWAYLLHDNDPEFADLKKRSTRKPRRPTRSSANWSTHASATSNRSTRSISAAWKRPSGRASNCSRSKV
jgi:hypothetical protein